ncbi:hypothetical protein TELCIR_03613 [Teladorsagia circumcincta]|uniref:Peptidase M13 N-terminal domain-containing protein n=1 Tax=Teladorsagia circumcincta TaxID=45464 RepID=A0A2G9UW47_TELCI|nr:hypothetical protein TELCIR_03613 [Teladorsagia circumcincta]
MTRRSLRSEQRIKWNEPAKRSDIAVRIGVASEMKAKQRHSRTTASRERIFFTIITLNPCIGNIKFNDECPTTADNATGFRKLADYLEFSINYKVDPCEDFYQFTCGSWIANTPDTPPIWGEVSPLYTLRQKYQEEQRTLLASNESTTSQAIAQARKFYHRCVVAEQQWEAAGIPGIKYVMKKIREFGVFPMLSEESFYETRFNAKFDFTWLLAYFNQNTTVLHTIVPRLVELRVFGASLISFYPSKSLFTFLDRPFTRRLQRMFTEFLVRLMKYIAADVGVKFNNTKAPPDILDLRIFMEKLHSIPIPDLKSLLENNNFYNYSSVRRLAQVDATVYKRFASKVDDSIHPRNRSEACFIETQKHYKVAMLAMYARSRSTEFLRPLVEEMAMGMIEELKEEIRENEWMDKEFKEVPFCKLTNGGVY